VLPLLLSLVVSQVDPATVPKPSTADTPSAVRLLFQAGDLRRAINMAKACAGTRKKGAKECLAMVKPLVEYQSIIGKEISVTAEDAKALFEYEKKISPEVPSKLSKEIETRFVTHPYDQALAARRAGEEAMAQELAKKVLAVQPRHEGALAIVTVPDAGAPDAGPPRPRTKLPKDGG
jgi:hypothetical protein